MKLTLNSSFYNSPRQLSCPKCKSKVSFTFKQLGTTIICPHCKVQIKLNDNVTPAFNKLK